MRLAAVLASIALSILAAHPACATGNAWLRQKKLGAETGDSRRFTIRVADGDWGEATAAEVEALLNAVANELLGHFPARRLDPIVVTPSDQGPIVLYARGPENEYQVQLAARDRHWAEFVYEFSHELFHILANYQHHALPRKNDYQWFEEASCEAVSLHSLKQLTSRWEQSPPQAEWAQYAASLRQYLDLVSSEPHRHLPEGLSFARWFQGNEPLLCKKPYLRDKNDLVAHLLLPLFKQQPDWEALGFLNGDSPEVPPSFQSHLLSWYLRTPVQHRAFVRQFLQLFGWDAP